jgi:hypothetical protein
VTNSLRHNSGRRSAGQLDKETEKKRGKGRAITEDFERLSKDICILNAFDVASSHRMLHVINELLPVSPQLLGSIYNQCSATNRHSGVKFSPLFKGSSAFGSKNKYCNPTITEFRLRTGFQSSLRMLRQTFPSRSTFG